MSKKVKVRNKSMIKTAPHPNYYSPRDNYFKSVRKPKLLPAFTEKSLTDNIAPFINHNGTCTAKVRRKESVTIVFEPDCFIAMQTLVQAAEEEVGWFSMVDIEKYGSDTIYRVSDIVIPKQDTGPAAVGVSPESLSDVGMKFVNDGMVNNINRMRFWGHSHVNMGVTPSGIDETQMNSFMDDMDFCIMCIMNKRGNMHLQLSYKFPCVDIIDIPWSINSTHDKAHIIEMLRPAINNVRKEDAYSYPYAYGKPPSHIAPFSDRSYRYDNYDRFDPYRSPMGNDDPFDNEILRSEGACDI